MRFDVLVIGSGPAGSAAAAVAARAGAKVALCDKHIFPRRKLCGGAFTGRAMHAFKTIFGQDKPNAPMLSLSRVEFHAFGKLLSDISDAPPLHMTMRYTLDAALRQRALDLGATDLSGNAFHSFGSENSVQLKDGAVQADIVIAADGVHSPVARCLFGQAFDHATIGFALEVELDDVQNMETVRIDLGAAKWGYGWQFPKTTGTTVGLGGLLARNNDLKLSLARYLQELKHAQACDVKGQFLPFGSFRGKPGHKNILLAGDAAGLVDPITGEGIAYALKSGEYAARSALWALKRAQPKAAFSRYRYMLRPIHHNIRTASLLRRLLFSENFQPTFVKGMQSSKVLRDRYLQLISGQTDYGPLLRHVMWRLPRHGAQIIGLG